MYDGVKFTQASDIENIVAASFRILNDCGVSAAHEKLASLVCEYNPQKIRSRGGRIYIDAGFARDYFMSFSGTGTRANQPGVSASAEIYNGPYLDARSGAFLEWTEERLSGYIKLAKNLPHIDGVSMLGCPVSGLPPRQIPLWEKLYSFKYGTAGPSSIWDTSLCPAIYEVWQEYAGERGADVKDVFCGTVYLVSPLRLGYVESEQIIWFRERGLKVGVGNLPSLGLSAPVTPAGAISQNIAEQLFLSILRAALYGDRYFGISCGMAVLDMRTCAFQYGRPERLLVNNATADIACYYNLPFWMSGGLSDAKVPSYEAGVQKMSAAVFNISKGRTGNISAGLLSVDEVHSPVQMVLDNEAAGYLKRVFRGFGTGEADLAFETIKDCAREDTFFASHTHTAENARDCVWEPDIFSRETYSRWNKKSDCDRAKERAVSIMEGPALEPLISEDCERRILKIIKSV